MTSEEADTVVLVLASQRISCDFFKASDNRFDILIDSNDKTRALQALQLYMEENSVEEQQISFFVKFNRTYSGLFISALMFIIHTKTSTSTAYHSEVVKQFGSSAERIVNGAFHLCVTSLFLHGDVMHLAGNMAGIALFCTAVVSICGLGTGWFMILIAGASGNIINGFFYRSHHVSIGASTAIFASLGILSAIRAADSVKRKEPVYRTLLPFGAGLALLGLLGSSQHTDVTAHFFGFCAGVVTGSFTTLFFSSAFSTNHIQWVNLVLTVIITAICWILPVS